MVHMLSIVQITLAILLTVLVLVQRANTDASGAGGIDGGTSFEKRGAEKTLHRLTIVIAVAFVLSLAYPLIRGTLA
jgi:protein translocase SecG subunit